MRRRPSLRVTVPVALAAVIATAATASASALLVASERVTTFATCTLHASAADAWIDQSSPGGNAGAGTELNVQTRNGNRNRRALVRFDLAGCGLPASATITSARLSLHVTSGSAARTYEARPLLGLWLETGTGGVTWTSQPDAASGAAPTASGAAAGARMTWDVTTAVAAIHDGIANHGWRIADTAENASTAAETRFAAREHGTISFRPRLTIGYHP